MLGESLVKLGTLVVLKQMGEQRESTELTGGGRSHERTVLYLKFPGNSEKYKELSKFRWA